MAAEAANELDRHRAGAVAAGPCSIALFTWRAKSGCIAAAGRPSG